MTVTSKLFGPVMLSLWNKELDFDTDTIKAMLVTATWTPNQDTMRYKSLVTNEVTGTGYTAGGVTLTSKTITYDGTSNTTTLDAADPSWTGLTATFRYVVFYESTGTDSTSPLISYVDLGVNQTVSGVNFTYVLPATGIAQFPVS